MEDELKTLRVTVAKLNLHLATLQQALLNKGTLTQAEIDAAQQQIADQAKEELQNAILPKPPGIVQ